MPLNKQEIATAIAGNLKLLGIGRTLAPETNQTILSILHAFQSRLQIQKPNVWWNIDNIPSAFRRAYVLMGSYEVFNELNLDENNFAKVREQALEGEIIFNELLQSAQIEPNPKKVEYY
jgi:hypothetical protein